MNSNIRLLIVAAGIAAITAGCNKPTEYKPKVVADPETVKPESLTADNLLPLTPGFRWTYDQSTVTRTQRGSQTVKSEIIFTIKSVTPVSNGKKIVVEILRDGKVVDRQGWLLMSKGLFQTSSGLNAVPYEPMQPIITLPPKTDAKQTWSGRGICPDGNPGTMTMAMTNRGPQLVDTGMGRVSAITVEQTFKMQSSKLPQAAAQVTMWFQPKVGIVRMRQTLVAKAGAIQSTMKLVRTSQ